METAVARFGTAGADAVIAAVAEFQHGVVSLAQLKLAGIGEHAVGYRVRTGNLHRVHRGVYAVGYKRLTDWSRLWAAHLAAPDAALSHDSAAWLWHIVPRTPIRLVHLTAETRRRDQTGLKFHEATGLVHATESHLPLTLLPRTLLDYAANHDVRQTEKAVGQAEYRHRLDFDLLDDAVPGHHGTRTLTRALRQLGHGITLTRSKLEEHFLALIRTHGLPQPVANDDVLGYQVDWHWEDHKLIVETDGGRAHLTRTAFQTDRTRDRLLQLAGYRILRFTYADVVDRPELVARQIAEALRR